MPVVVEAAAVGFELVALLAIAVLVVGKVLVNCHCTLLQNLLPLLTLTVVTFVVVDAGRFVVPQKSLPALAVVVNAHLKS